jgi:hypothetical protein
LPPSFRSYTNRRAKVYKSVGFESPLAPTLSPLDKGGEGREWGDSARAGICELWLGDWYYTNRAAEVHKNEYAR